MKILALLGALLLLVLFFSHGARIVIHLGHLFILVCGIIGIIALFVWAGRSK